MLLLLDAKGAFANLMDVGAINDVFNFAQKTTLGFHGPASDCGNIFLPQVYAARVLKSGELDDAVHFEGGDYKKTRAQVGRLPVYVDMNDQ